MDYRLLWIIAVLLFAILVIKAARAHDIYTHWKQPGTQMPCCSGGDDPGDCYPTDARLVNGQWFALRREDQKWLAVPANKVIHEPSDGQAHLCAPKPSPWNKDDIYCFQPPNYGS